MGRGRCSGSEILAGSFVGRGARRWSLVAGGAGTRRSSRTQPPLLGRGIHGSCERPGVGDERSSSGKARRRGHPREKRGAGAAALPEEWHATWRKGEEGAGREERPRWRDGGSSGALWWRR